MITPNLAQKTDQVGEPWKERITFNRAKTTVLPLLRCLTSSANPRSEIPNTSCSIAFLVNSYLASGKYITKLLCKIFLWLTIFNLSPTVQVQGNLPIADNHFIIFPIFNPSTNSTSFSCPFSIHWVISFWQDVSQMKLPVNGYMLHSLVIG